MTAQWEIECISLSACPLRGSGHGSSVGEWMYLTVCPLRGPGHDSSVGEWMYLTVLFMAPVMIAQWENECISLSVLFVARVMVARWENECISLSVLFVVRVMIARWENECISLSVLSMAGVQFPAGWSISRDLSLADHTLSTRGRKWFNLRSMASHNLWISRNEAEDQPWTDHCWNVIDSHHY